MDLIYSLYSWWEGFGVIFLSHTAPGFQLWFYFHLYMWVICWGLVPEAGLEGLGLPLWGPGVEVVQLLGSQGSGSTRYSGGLAARAAGNTVLWWVWQPVLAKNTPVFLPGVPPLRPRSLAGHSLQGRKEADGTKATLHAWTQDLKIFFFFAVAALFQWELRVRVAGCLACRDPGGAKCAGTLTASMAGVMALSEPLVAGDQKASLASLSL